jgi:hypothetical protein
MSAARHLDPATRSTTTTTTTLSVFSPPAFLAQAHRLGLDDDHTVIVTSRS